MAGKSVAAVLPLVVGDAGSEADALRGKLVELQQDLNVRFVERFPVVEGLIIAALAGEHVLLLGPPGTAKSALARALAEAFGGNHFEWLLSKFTTPEELFGPISLSALKCDRYERITAGKLPESHVSFLDEIFKSNSGVLNMLLPAINEGLFHNGQQPVKLPLRLLVGASNELPEGPELGALYDRFLLRYWTEYVQNEDSFESLMLGGTREEAGPTFSVEDWDQMRAGVARVTVPKGVISQLFTLREALSNAGIQPSDRRLKRCLNLLRAAAWLSGETEVSEEIPGGRGAAHGRRIQ